MFRDDWAVDLRSQSKAVVAVRELRVTCLRPSVLFDAQLVATPSRPADLLQKDVSTISYLATKRRGLVPSAWHS